MEETDWHQRENPAKLTRSLIKFNIVLSKQTKVFCSLTAFTRGQTIIK